MITAYMCLFTRDTKETKATTMMTTLTRKSPTMYLDNQLLHARHTSTRLGHSSLYPVLFLCSVCLLQVKVSLCLFFSTHRPGSKANSLTQFFCSWQTMHSSAPKWVHMAEDAETLFDLTHHCIYCLVMEQNKHTAVVFWGSVYCWQQHFCLRRWFLKELNQRQSGFTCPALTCCNPLMSALESNYLKHFRKMWRRSVSHWKHKKQDCSKLTTSREEHVASLRLVKKSWLQDCEKVQVPVYWSNSWSTGPGCIFQVIPSGFMIQEKEGQCTLIWKAEISTEVTCEVSTQVNMSTYCILYPCSLSSAGRRCVTTFTTFSLTTENSLLLHHGFWVGFTTKERRQSSDIETGKAAFIRLFTTVHVLHHEHMTKMYFLYCIKSTDI